MKDEQSVKRGGRKKKAPTVKISTRFTYEEQEQLRRQVEDNNFRDISSYIRFCTIEEPDKARVQRKLPVKKELLTKLLGQLGKAGGNLHQIAKYQNIYKESAESKALLSALSSFEEATIAILEALGRDV